LKQLFRSGATISKGKVNQFCSYKKKDEKPNGLEIFLKKFDIKFRDIRKEVYSGRRKKK
jgi:hypothetical protein